jgi:pimeloyl-ACP methyl ester carboxylesterase
MDNLRVYGSPPYYVAVIHGGPGAPGEMAPVARELSSTAGVLEPLQTAVSLEGQAQELHDVLQESGDPPMTLIGWSWGAWLGFILAARYPEMVRKLILIASGPFEEEYAADITETRLSRLDEEEKAEAHSLMRILNDLTPGDKDAAFARLGKLISRADSYDLMTYEDEALEYRFDVFQEVWGEASRLRASGELLELGGRIRCPVVAIHGDHDPHPCRGVEEPLARVLKDFRFVLLENCGHRPWSEKAAKDEFYNILEREL